MQTNLQLSASLDEVTDNIRRALAVVAASAAGAGAMLRHNELYVDIADGLDYAIKDLQSAYAGLPAISDEFVVNERNRVQEERNKLLPIQQQEGAR